MNTDIHRLLDEAFQGIEMTPDAQDLKEEVRANLVARADELEAAGVPPTEAAHRAIAELGDVRALLDATTDAAPRPHADGYAALQQRHRVRPKPGFVVRAVVWSIAAVIGITLGILGAAGVWPIPLGAQIGAFGFAATALGLLVGDSLSQETTTNHPMPQNRAAGYFLATLLGAYGLGFVALVALGSMPVWGVVFAALGIIASIILFAFLGASQTNRHKAWTRQAHTSEPPNRFEREPETAARFGIYSAVIWLVTFAVIAVLVFTVGWWWAPVAFVGGFAVMMLVLARMLFSPEKKS
ncbi:permease prefix domain 1-containing protein [Microbacterium sp. PRC9]|uniref:permease prefix domain 1-containing protein n=1 Tax=Microbacterium sp. PRC9 TaxID=2962591 RepID=UPI002880F7E3|nr:permease prefix domain 1-containing protein [Microbacterium sp. PRC9]MDT0140887.1 permease prefix domain 1-containing protein [Microbacterium sp. PRC9]